MALTLVIAAVAVEDFPGEVIALLLTLVAGAVACGVGASLAGDLLAHRSPVVVCSLVAVALGIVSSVLADRISADAYLIEPGLNGWDVAVLYVLPLAAVLIAFVPPAVRSAMPSPSSQAWTTQHQPT
jgi:hypothetical protein